MGEETDTTDGERGDCDSPTGAAGDDNTGFSTAGGGVAEGRGSLAYSRAPTGAAAAAVAAEREAASWTAAAPWQAGGGDGRPSVGGGKEGEGVGLEDDEAANGDEPRCACF